MFNYRNGESMKMFKNFTNNNKAPLNIFSENSPFPKQAQIWWKKVNSFSTKPLKGEIEENGTQKL